MIPEVVSLRKNLIKFLERDSSFDIFDEQYSFNGTTFSLLDRETVFVDFPNGTSMNLSIKRITDQWLRNNCNKAGTTKQEKKLKIKNKIADSSRIKPTVVRDADYMQWLREDLKPRCFVCGGFNGVELHHVKRSSSDHKNDTRVIPLCGESCHRTGREMSVHGTPVKFRVEYPVEIQLYYACKLYNKYLEKHGKVRQDCSK